MKIKLQNSIFIATLAIFGISNAASAQTMVKDIRPGGYGSKPNRFISMGNTLFFVADTSVTGNNPRLWKTDGTDIGTSLVSNKLLTNGGYSMGMATMGGYLYYCAYDANLGLELHRTDGTLAGTVMVKDIYSGTYGSNPSELMVFNGNLYFYANDGINGLELWRSDGTDAGTYMVKDIRPGQYGSIDTSYETELVIMNNILYFAAWDGLHQGHQLWKTDGTANGTVRVKSDNSIKYPEDLFEYNGNLYFSATDSDIIDRELFKSDGTDAGTILVKNIRVGNYQGSAPRKFTVANNVLYFEAYDDNSGGELWKTDGTASGTLMVKDIYSGGLSGLIYPNTFLTNCNNGLFFPANDGINGVELWKSDGTMNGTVLVKDISLGAGDSDPAFLVEMDNVLYFSGGKEDNTGVGTIGAELWKSDGTPSGTLLVKDIYPGVYSSNPSLLFNHNGILFFSADNGVHGKELWKYEPAILELDESANIIDLVKVYPNPSNNYITIENEQLNSTYVILNSIGQHVLSGHLIGEVNTIDISELTHGIYLVQIETNSGRVSKKIIKN
jgi:ELWxxDGT repeat protein